MRIGKAWRFASLALVAACASRTGGDTLLEEPFVGLELAEYTIRSDDVLERLEFLAGDELRGRDTPSDGLETAVRYLASELERMGLQPAGEDGRFIQRYPYGDATAPNVVAVLRGSDPVLRDEYVVLSAHFDHVGVGRPDETGDSIYNGADDNASGTAVLLEVAEAFSRLTEPPARSVVFLAVSGEEKGLLGARWWVEHPTVPIERVVANVNFDMVGRNDPGTVVAVGEAYTTLGSAARAVLEDNPELRLRLIPEPDPLQHAFFRSDQAAFVREGIPALLVTTWLHEDYHRPSDEVEAVDEDKAARVGRFTFRLAHRVADAPERPRWTEGSLERVREMLRGGPF